MRFRLVVNTLLAGVMIGVFALPGCGGSSTDNGPADEPNMGPGGPAGGATSGGGKAAGKAYAKPESFSAKSAGRPTEKGAKSATGK